jgi:hypothetical protein
MATLLLLSTLLAACRQDKIPSLSIVSEDNLPGNPSFISSSLPDGSSILRLGNGIYYNAGSNLNLHYYDLTTQKDVILCNKPECKHDGNEYCVATNAKYHPIAFQVYSGSIFATAYCMDEEKMEFKLLRFAPDGSSLSEVVTYYSTISTKIDQIPITSLALSNDGYGYNFLFLHRNKAYLPFFFHKEYADKHEYVYGLMELSLDSMELKSVFEETASENNTPWYKLSAQGDYVYYVADEPHKHLLHRRSILDSSDEVIKLLTNFTGDYVILDENRIAYLRNQGELVIHHLTDGNDEKITLMDDEKLGEAIMSVYKKGQSIYDDVLISSSFAKTEPYLYHARDLYTDGMYLYVIQPHAVNYFEDQVYGNECYYRIHIFNTDMEEITEVKLPDPQLLTGEPLVYDTNRRAYDKWLSVRYLGDQVYYSYKEFVFSSSMEDFLTGKPNFQLVYQKQYKKGEYPYEEN